MRGGEGGVSRRGEEEEGERWGGERGGVGEAVM